MTTHDIAKTERVEMYLKAVLTLQQVAPPATVSKVADFMGVSAPSASEMLRRLEHQGYVRGGTDGLNLTASGQEKATTVVRRLRLAERLLTDVLKLDLPKVYDEACKMEHVISDEVESRLAAVLGHPTTCPHGLPIPGEAAAGEADPIVTSRPLTEIGAGHTVRITSVPEEDSALLEYLVQHGLVPGAAIEVEGVAPFNGPLTLRIGRLTHAIGREASGRIRVR